MAVDTGKIFLVALLLQAMLAVSEGCSCYPVHPQQHFCRSDFVIRGTPERLEFRYPVGSEEYAEVWKQMGLDLPTTAVYTVRINHVFKGRQDLVRSMGESHALAANSLDNLRFLKVNISIPSEAATCGVKLELGEQYLLGGEMRGTELRIKLCDMVEHWNDVTTETRNGIRGEYDCHCHIVTCIAGTCEEPKKEVKGEELCAWKAHVDEENDDCSKHHVTCRRVMTEASHEDEVGHTREEREVEHETKCEWVKSSKYEDCERNGYNYKFP